MRSLGLLIGGLLLAVIGSVYWMNEPEFSPNKILENRLKKQVSIIDSNVPLDMSAACDVFNDNESWILFIVEANQIADSQFRTYFETTRDERMGLWLEYEPPLLRLGMGLGMDNPESSIHLPVRTVRRPDRITALIAVTRWKTRLLVNGRDQSSNWPNINGTKWRCDDVRLGTEWSILSEGYGCSGCNVQLRYVAGNGFKQLDSALDAVSNSRSMRVRKYVGSMLVLVGLGFIKLSMGFRSGRLTSNQQL